MVKDLNAMLLKANSYRGDGTAKCKRFNCFTKCDYNFVGIRLLVDKLKHMASFISASKRFLIYEVEAFEDTISRYYVNHKEATRDDYYKTYYTSISDELTVTLNAIVYNYVNAVYSAGIVYDDIFKVSKLYDNELQLATCNCDIYTDGCGNLCRDNGHKVFEKCNGQLDEVVGKYGHVKAYPDMHLCEVVNICNAETVQVVMNRFYYAGASYTPMSVRLGDVLEDYEHTDNVKPNWQMKEEDK